MRAIDTNVLVRLAVRDDALQAAAAERFIAGGAWVSLVVILEMAWVLGTGYGRTPAQIATSIELLLDHENLVVQDAEVVGKAVVAFRKHPSVGFADCLILEQARKAGHLPLGTFGRRLAKLEGAAQVQA